ncbi:MAG: signal recognition particle-docking protein FtsY [Opitutales bacterium]
MGIFTKFREGFRKGAGALRGVLGSLGRGRLDESSLERIEEALYESDFGVETTTQILDQIREAHRKDSNIGGQDVVSIARSTLMDALEGSEGNYQPGDASPEVVCLVGVNGSGKTTTCAKLGYRLQQENRSVMLGACDTFRAAAVEQLKVWSDRLSLEMVAGHHGADAAAVAFDAYAAAESRRHDVLLLDTAGRLHVKGHLMEELAKLRRVLQKRNPEAPHHSWLVVDGSLGTNSLEQARVFHRKFGLTGLVVTKLDGTSKGGALVAIYRELKLPIHFVGLGEAADDLLPFSAERYVHSLFADSSDENTEE